VTLSDPPGGYVDALASVAREACIVRRSWLARWAGRCRQSDRSLRSDWLSRRSTSTYSSWAHEKGVPGKAIARAPKPLDAPVMSTHEWLVVIIPCTRDQPW